MGKGRLEAFSDGVIAIIITIMVLELKVPEGLELANLLALTPIFLSYLLSYLFVGIYWNNHHHLLQASKEVDGRVLWANLHLLFWLSIIPFVTIWMGKNPFQPWPVALYGVVLLLAGVAYYILVQALLAVHGQNSLLAAALGSDFKGKASLILYSLAIPLAFVNSYISCVLYVVVAFMWLVPDQRIEKVMKN
jgi:uncharacterized membrane protein